MSTRRNTSPLGAMGDMDLLAPVYAQLRAEFATMDWLAHMILAVKTVAAGVEFIPLPYIRAAFGTVVIFLETVDSAHGSWDYARISCREVFPTAVGPMPLIPRTPSFLRLVQTGLENLMRSRAGLRGRFKEFLQATTVADQIDRYRIRVNELRSNFVLVATIDTNLNVADIQKSMSALQETNPFSQFRRVALGDINLLYETAMSSKVYKIKVFTARISGEPSLMTVAKYEDDNEVFYTYQAATLLNGRGRHPNLWQLFGISTAAGLHALIYYDELIPLPIYRQFHRPTSDLVWVCIEGMLVRSSSASRSESLTLLPFEVQAVHGVFGASLLVYERQQRGGHGQALAATICVKREPVQLCLTMPTLAQRYGVEKEEKVLSLWHTEHFRSQDLTADTRTASSVLATLPHPTLSSALARHMDWNHFFATLILFHVSALVPWKMQEKLTYPKFSMTYLEIRFTFPPGSFKALELPRKRILLSSSIALDEEAMKVVNMSWLSQANMCISEPRTRYRYGVVDMLQCAVMVDAEFQYWLRPEGTPQQAYIFARPIGVRHEGLRIGLESPESDQVYWSLDPSGSARMTEDECDSIGLPRLQICFFPTARFWHKYHYNAIHEFFEAKGFDSHSHDITRVLGLPLAEMESNNAAIRDLIVVLQIFFPVTCCIGRSGEDCGAEYAEYLSTDLGPLYSLLGLNPNTLYDPTPQSILPPPHIVICTPHLSCVFCPSADLNIVPTLRRRREAKSGCCAPGKRVESLSRWLVKLRRLGQRICFISKPEVDLSSIAAAHKKRPEGSLSALGMPKAPSGTRKGQESANFLVEINKQDTAGKVVYDSRGNLVKDKIKMTGAHFNGTTQDLYFPDDHPQHAGKFKGMMKILEEHGMHEYADLRTECPKFKCADQSDTSKCCCRRVVFNLLDFAAAKSILEDECERDGGRRPRGLLRGTPATESTRLNFGGTRRSRHSLMQLLKI
ncbi:hypothetical protein B0H19DRAFT_1083900 [Mycena capillaripes]|nr:hypothetical protein B0H19DRAFT_1083900 [Mycena capillaripes]